MSTAENEGQSLFPPRIVWLGSRSWQHAKFSSAIKNVLFARTVPDLDCMSVEVMRMIPFLEHHPMLLVLHLALDLIQRIFVNRNHPLVDFRMDH